MQCPNCHSKYTEDDLYCQQCGTDLTKKATSIIPMQANLPALLYNSQLPRNVAASVGAVAVGVGIELLRRNLLARLQPKRGVERALPALGDMKDLISSQNKSTRLPKGYEIEETVVAVRRIIRRTN
ncbi:zinc ribbon domain-containing protein [Dictyobacter formicarum]|uniref:Zinc-ribbon domain-containing protein n=1 Tax=Dictyobacter formicarum TaxID=2778368 RepID=A0ABQ3VBM3_9CHLR|nr:zinc ribbon domain-containing protein [Dictyobacter formicarum]GHO82871.1 hypothetical protein KSZ_08770 [Dictyobacter formicarum]